MYETTSKNLGSWQLVQHDCLFNDLCGALKTTLLQHWHINANIKSTKLQFYPYNLCANNKIVGSKPTMLVTACLQAHDPAQTFFKTTMTKYLFKVDTHAKPFHTKDTPVLFDFLVKLPQGNLILKLWHMILNYLK